MPDKRAEPAAPPWTGRPTVLVVDDDPSSLELVFHMVRSLGYEAVAARGGDEALELMESRFPQVVITDLMMPGVDGAALLRRVKERSPAVPVLIMSVVDSVEQAVRLLKSGADDYLTKPLSLGVLKPRLAAALERYALSRDVAELHDLIDYAFRPGEEFVLGTSEAFLKVVAKIPALARIDAAVLIHGESGTGKELVARAIHRASPRSRGALVAVDCATIPENLWERELFGHVKGAFSDSAGGSPGVVESADGGTLFLDEVGEIPLATQSKLLRFLQEKEYRPVGSNRTRKANVRLVSATNRDLRAETEAGRFRQDLFYRLNVVPLEMPPLRRRREDIPHLASHLLRGYAEEFGKEVVGFTPLALQKLSLHDYPGNVRELQNVVQQALVATRHSVICADDVPVGDPALREGWPDAPAGVSPSPASAEPGLSVDIDLPYIEAKQALIQRFERRYVEQVLGRHEGNVSRAARAAGLPRKSLSRIMARHKMAAGPDGTGGRPGRPPKRGA